MDRHAAGALPGAFLPAVFCLTASFVCAQTYAI